MIAVLPVLVALTALGFLAALWRLRRRHGLTLSRAAVGVVASGYGAGVVANTLFPIYFGLADRHQHWTVFLNLVPLVNTEPRDALQNVIVFLPLGVLLPLVARVGSWRRVVLIGFLLSLTMELLQLLNAVTGHGGHVADVNDLLANTIGAPLGYALYRAALTVPPFARWVAAFTWPPKTER